MPLSALKPRSAAALVRNLLDEIELALARGASREAVYETLVSEKGLNGSFNGFLKALARARADRNALPPGEKKPDARPAETESVLRNTEKMDCAIQKPGAPGGGKLKSDRIVTPETFEQVRDLDFTDLDPRYN